MNHRLAAYLTALAVMLLLDLLWLGFVARPVYLQGLGHLMADSPRLWAAAMFYGVYALGLLHFAIASPAVRSESGGVGRAAWQGALFGFVAYATYDLTNLATLRGWPLRVTVVDLAWGAVLGGVVSCGSALISRWLFKN
jgi:uncharacterized membrane protein